MAAFGNKVDDYFQSHKIIELLRHLSEMVFFFKPSDPVEFMAKTVLEMKMAANAGKEIPSLYNEESFRAYFRMLDPVGVGMISWQQLRSAFQVLDFKDIRVPDLKEMPVFEDTFVEIAMKYVNEQRLAIEMVDENGASEDDKFYFSETKLSDKNRFDDEVEQPLPKSQSVEARVKSSTESSKHDVEAQLPRTESAGIAKVDSFTNRKTHSSLFVAESSRTGSNVRKSEVISGQNVETRPSRDKWRGKKSQSDSIKSADKRESGIILSDPTLIKNFFEKWRKKMKEQGKNEDTEGSSSNLGFL